MVQGRDQHVVLLKHKGTFGIVVSTLR